ncbi:MAG: aminoglycoside adenylyltransferase domain-containing protein [Chloroflexota bacterium]
MPNHRPLPQDVSEILSILIEKIQQTSPELLNGLYIYGSLALGAYQAGKSDIDFVATFNHPCTEDDFKILQQIHSEIRIGYPQAALDGCYIQVNDLGNSPDEVTPYPYFDGESLQVGHYDLNLVTWWLLQHHGITVSGGSNALDSIDVDWDELERKMHQNLNSYWHDWATHPDKFAMLKHDGAIEWAVLGVLRLFYSFREKNIVSKVDAGNYALKHVESKWHPLINDALRIREGQHSMYEDKAHRQQEAQMFLQTIIDESNDILAT